MSGKNIGIILLLSLILFWVPLPFIDGKVIGSIIVLIISVYLLIK